PARAGSGPAPRLTCPSRPHGWPFRLVFRLQGLVHAGNWQMLARLPLLRGLKGYDRAWLGSDATAGLAVAAVAIPSAIAYPAIAGLPPEVGMYSSILPLIGYALFGPSRQLIVGPDAATMTVLAAVLAGTAADMPA